MWRGGGEAEIKKIITSMYKSHRRKKETEAKAKVVPSVWGEKFVQFLAALAVLPWSI